MEKPIIVERFADNGEHSHYDLIEAETGELLWSEEAENNNNEAIAFGDWLRRQRPDVFYGFPTTKQLFENFKKQ
jgi:hypothetical protein